MKTVRDLAPILEEVDEDQHFSGPIKSSLNDSSYDEAFSRRGSSPYLQHTSAFGIQTEEGHTSSKRLLEV